MALGILMPILFHALGLGPVFLPMFWPIAVGSFFMPLGLALLVSCLTPFLSMLLTHMPGSSPIAFIMMAELLVLSAAIVILRRYRQLPAVLLLAVALLLSRLVLLLILLLVIPLLGISPGEVFSGRMVASGLPGIIVVTGLPGIIVMLILVPRLVKMLQTSGTISTPQTRPYRR
jgi:hypothetical protein